MSRYGRRVILASIALHIIGLIVYFIYWLNTDPLTEKDLQNQTATTSNTMAEGEKNEAGGDEEEIPDTGKNPLEDYEDGDLSDSKVASLITNAQSRAEKLSTKEKVENLNTELKGISRTSVKEVEKMTNLAEKVFNIKKEKSKAPVRERKLNEKIDAASMALYDFEVDKDGMYILIFKDKNNIIIKGNPENYDDMDPDMKIRLTLMKKAKENKKFRMLLDTTNSILDKLHPPEQSKNEDSQ